MPVAARLDAPALGSALEKRVNPLTGALEVRYPLTWTGVRTYRHGGRVTRELRRPEQVFAPSHLRTLRRLAATLGHPQLDDGTPVFLDARGGPGAADGGFALRPACDYQVGHLGDEISRETVDGYEVPVAWCSVTSARAQAAIAKGALQSSLGYLCYLDEHPEPRTWDGPNGPEEYDVEHVLDHDDPRVAAAVERGEVPTVELLLEGRLVQVPVLGGNHHAIAIWAGRGARQSAARLDACCDECAGEAEAAPCSGAGCAAPGAWCAPAAESRLERAAASAAPWATDLLPEVSVALRDGLPADVASRPLSGSLPEPWAGWLAEGGDPEASPWLCLVRRDGLALAWPKRSDLGEVAGAPSLVLRAELRLDKPLPVLEVPVSAAPEAPAELAPSVEPQVPEHAERESAAAQDAPYAAPVEGPEAPHLRRTPALMTILKFSPKQDGAASAVAAALGLGAPSRRADGLDLVLPEGLSPDLFAAGLQALVSALGGMESQIASLEAAKFEADKSLGAQMGLAEGFKADAEALRADAEVGRKVRLERVIGEAKSRVAGLADADLEGLDADGVMRAAVAKRYPQVASKLDGAPGLVEALWEAAATEPLKPTTKTPAPVRRDEDDQRPPPAPPPAKKRLTAHECG